MSPEAQRRTELNYVARQAWIGFWHSCMRGVGGQSILPYDGESVTRILDRKDNKEPEKPKVLTKGELMRRIAQEDDYLQFRKASSLAQQLDGDDLIGDITLTDVMEGLDDYFKFFRQLKQVHPQAYEYFSKVGAPIASGTKIWTGILRNDAPISNPANLPSYFGVYLVRSKEERDDAVRKRICYADFALFEKRRKNIAVPSAWKYTIYQQFEVYFDRDSELDHIRPGPAKSNWFIGIEPNGTVRMLPMKLTRDQKLKDGTVIRHNDFMVPPVMQEIAMDMKDKLKADGIIIDKDLTVDEMTAKRFAIFRSFADAALSGIQIIIQRGKEVARFGLPLSHARNFFQDRDRDVNSNRRNALLHYVVGHKRITTYGNIVNVGEHLRGKRHFTWHGQDITITVPGLHHTSPESFNVESIHDEDTMPRPLGKTYALEEVGDIMHDNMQNAPNVKFRRGQPTISYNTHYLGNTKAN